MNNHKTLYGAEWCPGCKSLKKQLEANHVEFEYKDADDRHVMRELAEIGVRSLPFAVIGSDYITNPSLKDFIK